MVAVTNERPTEDRHELHDEVHDEVRPEDPDVQRAPAAALPTSSSCADGPSTRC